MLFGTPFAKTSTVSAEEYRMQSRTVESGEVEG